MANFPFLYAVDINLPILHFHTCTNSSLKLVQFEELSIEPLEGTFLVQSSESNRKLLVTLRSVVLWEYPSLSMSSGPTFVHDRELNLEDLELSQ